MTDPSARIPSFPKRQKKNRRMAVLFAFSLERIPGLSGPASIRVRCEEQLMCPSCRQKTLEYRDSVWRICRFYKGNDLFFLIPRGKCSSCGSVRRELPVFLCPRKHYPVSTIYKYLRNLHTPRELKEMIRPPCRDTIALWKRWAGPNLRFIRNDPDYFCFTKKARRRAAQSLAAFDSNLG